MIRKIVVPVDGSVHASLAVDWASGLAVKYQAQLLLLHVLTERGSGTVPEELREYAKLEHVEVTDWDIIESVGRRIVQAAEQRARSNDASAVETAIAVGNPAEVILDHSRTFGADLIVMGRRGLGPLPALILGSVSSKVVHLARVRVLNGEVIRRAAKPKPSRSWPQGFATKRPRYIQSAQRPCVWTQRTGRSDGESAAPLHRPSSGPRGGS